MTTHDMIREVDNPIKANVRDGSIEFKGVSFTYDKAN